MDNGRVVETKETWEEHKKREQIKRRCKKKQEGGDWRRHSPWRRSFQSQKWTTTQSASSCPLLPQILQLPPWLIDTTQSAPPHIEFLRQFFFFLFHKMCIHNGRVRNGCNYKRL